jgi:hypothetical protein
LYIDIYNTCITYPTFIILLAMADVEACFRFPCIHGDLTGAFGFLAGGYFNLANTMVFGSTASASSWEPFQRAIQALSVVYAHRHDLIKNHRIFLDKISRATPKPAPDLARAIPCSINTGVLDNQGNRVLVPAKIHVNDALMLAISKENMEQVLAALTEAIFVVMGASDTSVRQCGLAMDKWEQLHVAPIQTMLGLLINTNRMIVSIPDNYIQGVCLLIESTWHTHRTIHGEGGSRAHKKIGTPNRRCKLGLPPAHPPIHIHCICPLREQINPGRFLSRVSNPHYVTTVWLLFLQRQEPNPPHLFCHQEVCEFVTSITVSVQYHKVNAPRNRVLP